MHLLEVDVVKYANMYMYVYQCLLQRRMSRVIHPVGRRLDPVENIVPGHL